MRFLTLSRRERRKERAHLVHMPFSFPSALHGRLFALQPPAPREQGWENTEFWISAILSGTHAVGCSSDLITGAFLDKAGTTRVNAASLLFPSTCKPSPKLGREFQHPVSCGPAFLVRAGWSLAVRCSAPVRCENEGDHHDDERTAEREAGHGAAPFVDAGSRPGLERQTGCLCTE